MTSIPQRTPNKHDARNRDIPEEERERHYITPPPERRQARKSIVVLLVISALVLFLALSYLAEW